MNQEQLILVVKQVISMNILKGEFYYDVIGEKRILRKYTKGNLIKIPPNRLCTCIYKDYVLFFYNRKYTRWNYTTTQLTTEKLDYWINYKFTKMKQPLQYFSPDYPIEDRLNVIEEEKYFVV